MRDREGVCVEREIGNLAKRIVGYDGGDSEEALLKALREAIAAEVSDAWDKIVDKYMYMGSIIETAIAKGYVKQSRLGFAGYFLTTIGYAEKTCRDCLRCWEKRRDFFDVKAWVTSNNSYKPPKATGPLLFLDGHKAWLKHNDPDPVTPQQKKLTLKQARRMIHAYRSMLDRVGGEHVKQAELNQFEPRVWHQITMERAALEAEMSENTGDPTPFPVTATRDDEADEAEGAELDDAEEGGDPHQGTVEEQTPGTGFSIAEPVVPPPRHPPRPVKPTLALSNEPAAQDAMELLRDLAAREALPVTVEIAKPVGGTPPSPITLDAKLDAVAETEGLWKLKGWAGKPASDDAVLRSKRASFLRYHPDTSTKNAAWLGAQKRDFWRGERDDAAVIARLPDKGE